MNVKQLRKKLAKYPPKMQVVQAHDWKAPLVIDTWTKIKKKDGRALALGISHYVVGTPKGRKAADSGVRHLRYEIVTDYSDPIFDDGKTDDVSDVITNILPEEDFNRVTDPERAPRGWDYPFGPTVVRFSNGISVSGALTIEQDNIEPVFDEMQTPPEEWQPMGGVPDYPAFMVHPDYDAEDQIREQVSKYVHIYGEYPLRIFLLPATSARLVDEVTIKHGNVMCDEAVVLPSSVGARLSTMFFRSDPGDEDTVQVHLEVIKPGDILSSHDNFALCLVETEWKDWNATPNL